MINKLVCLSKRTTHFLALEELPTQLYSGTWEVDTPLLWTSLYYGHTSMVDTLISPMGVQIRGVPLFFLQSETPTPASQ